MAYDLATRREWRAQCHSGVPWAKCNNRAQPVQPGEAGGFLVEAACGTVAYLKPLKTNTGPHLHPRAANEKIASDLAHEIDANVPPVLLYERTDQASGEPAEVALSLVHPGTVYEWRDLFQLNHPDGGINLPVLKDLARRMLREGSPVVALDAWLHNRDRYNERNAIVTYAVDGPDRLYFLDFANTMDMGDSWSQQAYQAFGKLTLPPFFASSIYKKMVQETAERIEAISDSVVGEIVGRIPDGFLQKDDRDRLLNCLLWRKKRLCGAFDQWYPGS
jgi:hypothetical protein